MYLMAEANKQYGQVFTVPVFHKRITFLLGPEVTPHFFKARRMFPLFRAPPAQRSSA